MKKWTLKNALLVCCVAALTTWIAPQTASAQEANFRDLIKKGETDNAKSPPAATSQEEPAASEPKIDPASGTQILKWKDGKKAVFLLAFDDSAASQLQHAVPELIRRKMTGTFYLVTGNSLYSSLKSKWEEAAKSPWIEIANHTFTHKGANTVEELDVELKKCNEVIYPLRPERKMPRLVGFGKPGGVPWKITVDEQAAALAKHHLVDRPPFHGPPMHYKSAAEMIAAVDSALAKGGMGHMDFHGIGGDWLVTPLDWFTALLDKLEASRDQLWITDVVSYHKYLAERQEAELQVVRANKDHIELMLTSKADPALYDLPLSLSTKVPPDWKNCLVTQGPNKDTVPVKDGAAAYSALPGGGVISLQAAK